MTSLAESLDSVGERIVDWALVGSPVTDAPVRGWPLARFSTALAIAVAYLAFVVLGSLFARATSGEGVKSRAARKSTTSGINFHAVDARFSLQLHLLDAGLTIDCCAQVVRRRVPVQHLPGHALLLHVPRSGHRGPAARLQLGVQFLHQGNHLVHAPRLQSGVLATFLI